MFVRESQPDPLTEEGLDALCVSLNRPVLDIEDLPASPASAAIAVHGAVAGEMRLVVGLRSIDDGVVCAYSFKGERHKSIHQAMDVGLSFAESMGFLFDEDMISGDPGSAAAVAPDVGGVIRRQKVAKAHAVWCELIGEEPAPVEEQARPESVPLSKFRDRAVDSAAEAPSEVQLQDAQQAHLGRIPIVRRRRRGDTLVRADFQTRLLASF
jgi:hypothetical protein